MLEWLVTIGTAELGKVVFEQVLKLGQAAAEDYVKDFFKGCLKGGILAAKPEVAKKATAAAVQAFLLLLVDELEDKDISKAEIRDCYDQPMVQFVQAEAVKPVLGSAFEKDCRAIDMTALAAIWQQSTLKGKPFPVLPEGFDWQHIGSDYLRRVRRLVRETPDLRLLLETELLEDLARNTAQISPGFDVAKYRESLQTSFGHLKLYAIDSTDHVDAIKLWSMFIEQTVREALPPMRYELPLDLKQQLQAQGQLEADLSPEAIEHYRREYFQQPSQKVLEVVADSKQTVILGDPGAGKSTLLQYLALEWVEGKMETLPLLIELREYAIAQTNSFLDFLHRGRGADWQFDQQQLHQHLQDHPTLVMFDGLDEVFDRPTQAAIIADIIRFAQQYPYAQILITSRIIGYNPDRLQYAGFRHFTIQPLDTDEIHEFIDRWYTLALGNEPDKPRLVTRLKDVIANSKAIRNLADNPLLLTMMAILNRRQELPRDRADLYDQASRVLLYHWDVDHKRLHLPMDTIGRREKQEMLRLVAYEMQAGEEGLKGNLISADRLTRLLTNYLRDQGFGEPREKANGLINQLRYRNFILCDRGADTYGFVHRTFLEYFCAVEVVNRFEKQRTLTFDQLRDEVFGQHWHDETWHEVLRLVCGMIDVNFAGRLIEFLLDQECDQTKFLKRYFRGYCLKPGGLTNLLLAADCLFDVNNSTAISQVQGRLLEKLQHEIDHPKAALTHEAAKELVVRLAQNFSDSLLLPLLKRYTHEASDEAIRNAALEAIAERYQHNPDTLLLLKQCTQDDSSQYVREASVLLVAKYHNKAPETLPWLEQQMHHTDPWVRCATVTVLTKYYLSLPKTYELLLNVIQSDPYDQKNWQPNPRQAALKAFLAHYPTHFKTHELLHDRATNDPDEQLREWAQQQLEQRVEQAEFSVAITEQPHVGLDQSQRVNVG